MSTFFQNLDPGQLKAITSDKQHILCLAGAGSGKTRVLTSRVFYLIKKKQVNPKNILAITFTKNAAQEMKTRLVKLGLNIDELWCKTFHAAAYKILKENLNFKTINILSDKDQEKYLIKIINSLNKNKDFAYKLNSYLEENNWPQYLFIEQIYKVIKEVKCRSIDLKDLRCRQKKIKDPDSQEFYYFFNIIYYHYQNFLKNNKLFDFSDLLNSANNTLLNKPQIRQYYQSKFQYILVDEFQDVNFSQVQMLNLLLSHKNNLFVVGDDWQSIYAWRGANVNYILDFKNKFKNSEIISLPYNYRSDRYIVDAASKIIKKNKKQFRKKIKSFKPKQNKIKLYLTKDNHDAFNFVISKIKELSKKIKPENMAVLGRNWKVLSPYLEKLKNSTPPMFTPHQIGVGAGVNNRQASNPCPQPLGRGKHGQGRNNALLISTIHSVKGLEKDIVFIIGLYKGRHGFPYLKEDYEIMKIIRKTNLNERLEEERRCFYVGLTRAKKILYLITIKDRESQFIKEIPKRYLQLENS